ncbi:MAG TPA: hypothetical protein PK395_18640, partial [bacterium]|nr:hypothetical protein [bacterium]
GDGWHQLSGGTFSVNASVPAQSFLLSGGTLTGAGTLTVSGSLSWSGGTMAGEGKTAVASGGTFSLYGGDYKYLNQRTIDNSGTATWSDNGHIRCDNGPVFNNLAGGVFEIRNDRSFYRNGTVTPVFNNAGTVQKTTGTGSSRFENTVFTNTGVVQTQSGSLYFSGEFTSEGEVNPLGGTTIQFDQGTFVFNEGTSCTGEGWIYQSNSSLAITTPISAPNFILENGTLSGYGSLDISGTFDWRSGTMRGLGSTNIGPGGTLSINGGGTKRISQRTLSNAGTATWTGSSDIRIANGADIRNLNGATFDVQVNRNFYFDGGAVSTFSNAGTFIKSNGEGSFKFDHVDFTNSGVLQITAGQTFVFAGESLHNEQTGIIRGTGTLDARSVLFTNSGTINPGSSTGILNILGNLSQYPTGVIDISIGGMTPGEQFDQLVISGALELDGSLYLHLLDNFEPLLEDLFSVITCGSLTGRFQGFSLPIMPNDLGWDIDYQDKAVVLEVIHAAPDLSLAVRDDPDPLLEGSTVSYFLTVTNEPLYDAVGVSVINTLPDGMSFVSAETSQGTFAVEGNVLTANLGTIPKSATAVVTINASVNASGTYTNSSEVQLGQPDPDLTNNSATETTTVLPPDSVPEITGFSPTELKHEDIPLLTIHGQNFAAGTTVTLVRGDRRDELDPPDVVGEIVSISSDRIDVLFDLMSYEYLGEWDVVVQRGDGKTVSKPIQILPSIIIAVGNGFGTLGFPIAQRSGGRRNGIEFFNVGNDDGFAWIQIEPPAPGAIFLEVYHQGQMVWSSETAADPSVINLLVYMKAGTATTFEIFWWVPPENVIFQKRGIKPQGDNLVLIGEEKQVSMGGIKSVTAKRTKRMIREILISTICGGIGENLSSAQEIMDKAIDTTIARLEKAANGLSPEDLLYAVGKEMAKSAIPFAGQLQLLADMNTCMTQMVKAFLDKLNGESKKAADRLRRRSRNDDEAFLNAVDQMSKNGRASLYSFHALTRQGGVVDQMSSNPCNPSVRSKNSYSARVRGAWDPNDKTSNSPFPCDLGEVEGETRCMVYYMPVRNPIEYTIQFENKAKATDPAENVVVTDVLDSALDPSSLKVIATSHPDVLTTEISGQTVTFRFTNINLPPNVTPPEGDGFISYRVRPRPRLAIGTVIQNTASIVFDYNPPIVTPTVTHILVEPDLNGDGRMDDKDLILMKETFHAEELGNDLNGDSEVNARDAFIFSRFWQQGSSIPEAVRRNQ